MTRLKLTWTMGKLRMAQLLIALMVAVAIERVC